MCLCTPDHNAGQLFINLSSLYKNGFLAVVTINNVPYIIQEMALHFQQDWLSCILLNHNPKVLKNQYYSLISSHPKTLRRLVLVGFELAMRSFPIHRQGLE